MTGRLPTVRGRHARRSNRIKRASAGLSPARAGALLGILVAGAALYGVGASDVFGYERLELPETRYTDPESMRTILAVSQGANLFELRTEPLAQRLRALPTVLDARVEVSLPDTLVVRIVEREPILVWRVGDLGYLVDPSGVIFTVIDDANAGAAADLLSVTDARASSAGTIGPGTVIDPVYFDAATRLAALVPDDIGSSATSLAVTITDSSGFLVSTRPGSWVAVFGFYTPSQRKTELIPGQVRLLRSLLVDREAEIERIILGDDDSGTYVPKRTPKP